MSRKFMPFKGKKYILTHTYIIGHYNPSVRIDLVLHTTHVVLILYKWRDLQFKVDSVRQILWATVHGNFIPIYFCQKSAERKSPKKYFLYL